MGKDAAVSWLPEWFLYCFGGPKGNEALVPTTSASGRQIDTLWREINGWSSTSKAAKAFDLLVKEMRLRFVYDANGNRVVGDMNKALGFKAANAVIMESFHAPHLLYIMTEARGCEDWAYLAMYKACTGMDNRIVIQSVPGEETGEFFKIASGQRNVEDRQRQWDVLTWPAAKKVWYCPLCDEEQRMGGVCSKCNQDYKYKYVPTSKLVTQESINEKLAYGEDSEWFQGPVLANFIKGSSRSLITLSEYMDAESRYGGEGGLVEGLPDVLGCDIAWTGQNFTVLCHRKGPVLYQFYRWQGMRTDYTADRIMEWLVANPHGIATIENGIAQSGVIDQIIKAQFGSRLVLVNPGAPPVSDQDKEFYVNQRAQLYFYLQQRFKKGTIAIREKRLPLGGQLTAIPARVRTDMKFEIESKDTLLKKMPSPDDADAAMLSMAGSPDVMMTANVKDVIVVGQTTNYDW